MLPQVCICPLWEHQPSLVNISAAVAAERLPCKHCPAARAALHFYLGAFLADVNCFLYNAAQERCVLSLLWLQRSPFVITKLCVS